MMKLIATRKLMLALGLALTWGFIGGPPPAVAAEERPWNFLVVLLDDAGWRDIGFTGNAFVETPEMDHLAKEGMMFRMAYATHPFCSPTRQSMITGQWPARTAWMQRDEVTNPDAPRRGPPFAPYTAPAWTQREADYVSLPQLLKPYGYAVGHIGKWHYGTPHAPSPEEAGFDLNFGGGRSVGAVRNFFAPFEGLPGKVESRPGEYLTDRLSDETIRFIRANKDRPFYLQLWHYAVHTPIQAPEATVLKYRKKRIRMGDPSLNPTYAAMMEHVDTGLGRIRAVLKELELEDRTVIMLVSDNGAQAQYGSIPFTSVAPLRGEKEFPYEGGIRVPMVVYWPGHTSPGSVTDAPVSVLDYYPTILDIAGIPHPTSRPVDGDGITRLLETGDTTEWMDRPLFWYDVKAKLFEDGTLMVPVAAVRRGPWKLIHNYGLPLELYHLLDDPAESVNRAKEEPALVEELRQLLDQWVLETGVAPPVPNPDYDPNYVIPHQLAEGDIPALPEAVRDWNLGEPGSPWTAARMVRLVETNGYLRLHAKGIYPEMHAPEKTPMAPGLFAVRVELRVATSGRIRFHWQEADERGVVELYPTRDGAWHRLTGIFEAESPIQDWLLAAPTHLKEGGHYDPDTQPDYIEVRRIEIFRLKDGAPQE